MAFQQAPEPVIVPKIIPPDFAENNGSWLLESAAELVEFNKVGYMLIHADDGVLWGRIDSGQLVTPRVSDPSQPDEWTPNLRSITIQQCRVFSRRGELFIWREAEGVWKGRLLIENGGAYRPREKKAILYGSRIVACPVPQGFTAIIEPGVGMRQIVPLQVPEDALKEDHRDFKDDWRVVLTAVEYLSEDEDGQVMIICSRLKAINVAQV